MMSEEESDPEDVSTFRRRRPLWRSEIFNTLIEDVDSRCNGSKSNSKRLKRKRVQGEPLDTSAPACAEPWMVNIASPVGQSIDLKLSSTVVCFERVISRASYAYFKNYGISSCRRRTVNHYTYN